MSRPLGSDDKESACDVVDPGSIFGLGRPPGEGNGNSLQSGSMDRGAWWAIVESMWSKRVRHD